MFVKLSIAAITTLLLALPTGAHAAETVVSDPGVTSIDPVVAVAESGVRTVVWTAMQGGCGELRTAQVAPDGTAGPASAFPGAGDCAAHAEVEVARDGVASVVWASEGPTAAESRIELARIAPDGTVGLAQELAVADRFTRPQIDRDRQGRALVVFVGPRGESGRIERVTVSAAGDPGPAMDVSRGTATSPRLAMNAGGRAVLTWVERGAIRARAVSLDDSDAPIRTLNGGEAGDSGRNPVVDVNRRGVAAVSWADQGEIVFSRLDPKGAILGRARVLDPGAKGRSFAPRVKITSNSSTVAWILRRGGDFRVVRTGVLNGTPDRRVSVVAHDARGVELVVDNGGNLVGGFTGRRPAGAFVVRLPGGYHQGAVKRLIGDPARHLRMAGSESGHNLTAAVEVGGPGSHLPQIVVFRIAS